MATIFYWCAAVAVGVARLRRRRRPAAVERVLYAPRERVLVSVVMPAFNEEAFIVEAVRRVEDVLEELGVGFEIIVVNDGSTDGTLARLRRLAAVCPRLRVLSYDVNVGKGHAVKLGVLSAAGEFVVIVDSDLDVSPGRLGEYLAALRRADLVVASKRHPLSRVETPLVRRFLSLGYNVLVRLLLGVGVRDAQTGLKAARGDFLRRAFRVIVVKRFAYDTELLLVARLLGARVVELPVSLRIDKGFRLRDVLGMLLDLLAICYRHWVLGWYRRGLAGGGEGGWEARGVGRAVRFLRGLAGA